MTVMYHQVSACSPNMKFCFVVESIKRILVTDIINNWSGLSVEVQCSFMHGVSGLLDLDK